MGANPQGLDGRARGGSTGQPHRALGVRRGLGSPPARPCRRRGGRERARQVVFWPVEIP
jgi:hypothetical protein